MKKSDEDYSERRQARMKAEAQQVKASEAAGDPTIPEGQMNEPRKNYRKLLRDEYQFNQDVNTRESDDIILGGGCNSITDDI
jgi:hypothetical protein